MTGATGHLGSAVIRQLLKKMPAHQIAALVRDESKASKLKEAGVNVRLGDFDDRVSLDRAMSGIEQVLLISGTNEEDGLRQHQDVVNAAKMAGAASIAYTGRNLKDRGSLVNQLMKRHFDIEDFIKASGLAYILFRNALYMDTIPQFVGEKVFETGIKLPTGEGRVAFTLRSEQGEAIANALAEGVGQSRVYKLTEKDLKELLAKQAAADAERATLYRLFRRGGISEGDLNAQLDELLAEEKALTSGVERLEREVVKARDAETLLAGAKELLKTLKAKLDLDDSWASKRRIVEALVAGVEVESHLNPCAPRGKARMTSLRISYRFEVPDLEDAAPRTAKTPLAPSGLMLRRAHQDVVLVADAHEEAREAAEELLRANPKLQGTEVIATLQTRGLLISPASVSRLRAELKQQGAKGYYPIGNTGADAAL